MWGVYTPLFIIKIMSEILQGIMSGVPVLGDIFSSIFNSNSQNKANATNLKIAQMNNEFNEAMLQKQMDYNTMMWEKNNEYNSPSAQMQRMREAGINPFFAQNGVSSGSLQSSLGVNPPSASPVQVQAPQVSFPSLSQMASTLMDINSRREVMDSTSRKTDAEAEQVRIENRYRSQKLIAEIAGMMENTKNTKLRNVYQNLLNSLQNDVYGSDVKYRQNLAENIEADTHLKIAQTFKTHYDASLSQGALKYFDEQMRQNLAEQASRIALNYAQMNASYASVRKAIQDVAESIARERGIKLNNEVLRKSSNSLINKNYYESLSSRYRSDRDKYNASPDDINKWYYYMYGIESMDSEVYNSLNWTKSWLPMVK